MLATGEEYARAFAFSLRFEERLFSEYKKMDGVQVPLKLVINRDGEKYVETEVTEFKRMEKLESGLFDKP